MGGLRLTLVAVITATVTLAVYIQVVGVPASAVGGDLRAIDSHRPGLRVLFIGNSLTYVNSLAAMVHEFAGDSAGGPPIYTYQYAPGGAWLSQTAASPSLARLLTLHRWSYVVLQENSHIAEERGYSVGNSVPAGRALDELVLRASARPIVFETWGYRYGDRHLNPADTYSRMQERVQYAAQVLRKSLDAFLAPVGYAWSVSHRADPTLDLWQDDFVHPALPGSYLAAAVFTPP